ncbi:hypothetical protein FQR65_LT16588 [Abscondita terminalis]|nr:hypothetical protein FQR65_LT16588 [Abscondita terminalis]
MVNYCCVANCCNNSRDNKNLSFFTIPVDSIRQLQLLERIGRLELMEESPDTVKNRRVCSEHFEAAMFAAGFSFNQYRLTTTALPTLFKEGVGYRGINVNASTSGQPAKKAKLQSIENIENVVEEKLPEPLSVTVVSNFFQYTQGANCIQHLDDLLVRTSSYDPSLLTSDTATTSETIKANEVFQIKYTEYASLELPERNALAWVSGYLIKKCLNKHKCDICKNYSKHQTDLSNDTILCHFRAYETKDRKTFGNLRTPPETFYNFVNNLDIKFCSLFPIMSTHSDIGYKLNCVLQDVDFYHPCPMFPKRYLLGLYTRFRIFYALKFANKDFTTQKVNRKCQKIVNILHL